MMITNFAQWLENLSNNKFLAKDLTKGDLFQIQGNPDVFMYSYEPNMKAHMAMPVHIFNDPRTGKRHIEIISPFTKIRFLQDEKIFAMHPGIADDQRKYVNRLRLNDHD